jgi:hypothetical protein
MIRNILSLILLTTLAAALSMCADPTPGVYRTSSTNAVSPTTKATPTPDPNSSAAKAAEKERNLRPRPASQTGTNL